MTMLLTLCAGSLRSRLGRNGKGGLSMLDLPSFTIKQLRLHGLNIPASMLGGWSLEDLDKLRDRADKAACPCLVLIEDAPLRLGHPDPKTRREAGDRVRRLAVAANRLGCNAVAIQCDAPDAPDMLDLVADEIRSLMPPVERLELNVLLAPYAGLTQATAQLTALIKRVGGFRIGSLPNFATAAAGGDPTDNLRRLAPYAGAIHATVQGFTKKGEHKDYDLAACVAAIRGVGFLNTLAIDYTGKGDPIPNIEMARDLMQSAIDSEQS
ncbi:MAG: sugar phosphate isomerase/epimerase [Phycisphaerales bacterium]|nr:sugar phosphate isomerase/epimerase [Phycisphaerales bacterium]MCI0676354.1 sugar phosphate isomerase/epimerase [Phycisphaerales bacterium]